MFTLIALISMYLDCSNFRRAADNFVFFSSQRITKSFLLRSLTVLLSQSKSLMRLSSSKEAVLRSFSVRRYTAAVMSQELFLQVAVLNKEIWRM